MFLSNEMKCSLQCRRQIFTVFELFCRKVILELNCTKSLSLELLRTQFCVLVQLSKYVNARPQMLKSFFLKWEKLLNTILRAKLQVHEHFFFPMKWTCFLQCRRQIFTCLSFFAEKVILELNCTNHFFRASKNTNSVF